MQRKIESQLVCGSCGAGLDCLLPGVQVTAGLEIFFYIQVISDYKHSDSLLIRLVYI